MVGYLFCTPNVSATPPYTPGICYPFPTWNVSTTPSLHPTCMLLLPYTQISITAPHTKCVWNPSLIPMISVPLRRYLLPTPNTQGIFYPSLSPKVPVTSLQCICCHLKKIYFFHSTSVCCLRMLPFPRCLSSSQGVSCHHKVSSTTPSCRLSPKVSVITPSCTLSHQCVHYHPMCTL